VQKENTFFKRREGMSVKKGLLFLFLGVLATAFLFNASAFGADTTPPQILELKLYPGLYVIGVRLKTNEPVRCEYITNYWPSNNWISNYQPISNLHIWYTEPRTAKAIFNIRFRVTDAAGNITETQAYEISTYPYLRGSLNINNNSLTTNSRNVTLALQAFDPEFQVTEMCFSNDNQNWSDWEPYQVTKNWQLSEGEGLKTVYARFKNKRGFFIHNPAVDSIYYTTQTQALGPSLVQIKGKQLLVQKPLAGSKLIPYKIKGVCWSPASIGNPGWGDITAREIEFNNWYKQDIALMKEMGINTVRTYLDFGQDINTSKEILDELYNSGIMVILMVEDSIADMVNLERVVSNFKSHPAILAWQIGNEWNLYDYYGVFSGLEDSLKFTERAAERIKQLDPYHPVISTIADSQYITIPTQATSAWGYDRPIEYLVSLRCPAVDIWGINVYRGGSFGGLFYEWFQISPKPMFVSEAGTDSYDQRITNENPQMQADFTAGLWDEVYFHLSADRPTEPCLGITFFEWNDEWWKNNNPFNHDSGGYYNQYAHPDNISDEEYYGLVDIYRSKKQAYFTLENRYKKQGQVINLVSNLNLSAISTLSLIHI